jgi:predicted RNA-binding Zn-ribbon protein involved in translation (DUF1610 family)
MQSFITDFKTVKYHWFQCPRCGHQSWNVAMRSQQSRVKPRLVFVYRCARCRQLSVLSNWRNLLAAGVAISIIQFLVFYRFAISGRSLPLILFVGLTMSVVTVVLGRLMGRWLNRYVAVDDINS